MSNGNSTPVKVLDFAGGTVVHINAGVAGLMCALCLGKRKARHRHMAPHNMVLTFIGASLLWVGWFGFNAGSAVTAACRRHGDDRDADRDRGRRAHLDVRRVDDPRKPTVIGICSGAVAGLVAITPASGFVGPVGSLAIGIAAGVVCYWGVSGLKRMFGMTTRWTASASTASAASSARCSPACSPSSIRRHRRSDRRQRGQMMNQVKGIVVVIVYDAIVSLILLKSSTRSSACVSPTKWSAKALISRCMARPCSSEDALP